MDEKNLIELFETLEITISLEFEETDRHRKIVIGSGNSKSDPKKFDAYLCYISKENGHFFEIG